MSYCVMCGSQLPPNQGSKTCSMCYGDIDHGKDGYYRDWMEQNMEHPAELAEGGPGPAQLEIGEIAAETQERK